MKEALPSSKRRTLKPRKRSVVVTTTVQLQVLRSSYPVRGVLEIRDGEDL